MALCSSCGVEAAVVGDSQNGLCVRCLHQKHHRLLCRKAAALDNVKRMIIALLDAIEAAEEAPDAHDPV